MTNNSDAGDTYIRTYYVSHFVDLPPLVAQAAYDDISQATTDSPWILHSATGRIVTRAPIKRWSGPGYRPHRSQRAMVLTRWHRWPVELELMPWSGQRVEVGLRSASEMFKRRPPDSVLRAEHELLATLAYELQAWADQPLAEWATCVQRELEHDPLSAT